MSDHPKKGKLKVEPLPPPNPDWTYSEPVVTKRGDVWVDAMQLTMLAQMYDALGVPKVPGDGR